MKVNKTEKEKEIIKLLEEKLDKEKYRSELDWASGTLNELIQERISNALTVVKDYEIDTELIDVVMEHLQNEFWGNFYLHDYESESFHMKESLQQLPKGEFLDRYDVDNDFEKRYENME